MISSMTEDSCFYGISRHTEIIDQSTTVKFAFSRFTGSKTPRMLRARLGTHRGAIDELFLVCIFDHCFFALIQNKTKIFNIFFFKKKNSHTMSTLSLKTKKIWAKLFWKVCFCYILAKKRKSKKLLKNSYFFFKKKKTKKDKIATASGKKSHVMWKRRNEN